ncbi:MAG: PEGA domain-containing protein [Lentisphaerae bacterium]|nr:PEGA domain-containing protein [Lentisphaerota bacterium]
MKENMRWIKYFAVTAALLAGGLSLLSGCEKNPLSGKTSSFSVATTPDGAEVYVDGKAAGITPCTVGSLAEGSYAVEIRKGGYESAYANLFLAKGESKNLKLQMKPITGLLQAVSNPEGAEVLIDGVSRGTTPLLLTDLPLGEYRLEFQIREKFLPRTREVRLIDRSPVKVEVNLDSRMARLKVGSSPAGAEILVNGVLKGTTPMTVEDVVPGNAEVRVEMKGYIPFVREMAFAESTPYEINPVLEALPAGLSVFSSPSGAAVFVDNEDVGVTPLTLSELQGGVHEVKVTLVGYAEQTKIINLQPSVNESVDFNLVKDSGILMLVTEPAGVDVFVDGRFYAATQSDGDSDVLSMPLQVLLKAGAAHTIQLYKDGFVSSSFNLNTKVDEVVNKRQALKRIFVYDTRIVMQSEIIKCRLEHKLPNGDIYYERYPGIFGTAKAADILEVQTITIDDADNIDARRQMNESRRPLGN